MGIDVNNWGGAEEKNGTSLQLPMRIVLIPQSGKLRTIWLPGTAEGRYRFLNSDGLGEALPFYVEKSDGDWVAYSGKSAYFVRTNTTTGEEMNLGHEMPLKDVMLAHLRYKGEKYALYSEIEQPKDHLFLPYYLEERSDYTIGRSDSNLICYANQIVSRVHAVLHWKNGVWEIIDQNSSNGTYVNGERVRSRELHVGDSVFIMGLYILMGSGFVSINNANGRVKLNTPKIRHITNRRDVFYPEAVDSGMGDALFDRQPRKLTKVAPEPIVIEMPPMPISGNKVPLLLRLGSPMLMGGQALATGNILMAMTSMVFPSLTQGLTEKDRKEYEAKRTERYREYLVSKREEILQEKKTEEQLLARNDPELSQVVQFAVSRDRLWERRKSDDDFLNIRIGSGKIPLIAKRNFNPRRFELERDVLAEEMYEIAEQPVVLERAPVVLSLVKDYILGILGDRSAVVELVRNIVVQTSVTHSYDEVKIVLLSDQESRSELNFVRYLPHNWDDDRSTRFFAASQPDAQQLTKYLSPVFQDMLDSRNNNRNYFKHKASFVVIVLSKRLFDCVEILKDVLDREEYCGISVLTAFDSIPKECGKIIDLRGQSRITDLSQCDVEDQQFVLDRCDEAALVKGLRQVMETRLKLNTELYSLPNMITFLEMYGVGKVEHLNPAKRWAENNPVKSLAAPVGVSMEGELFTLDLHEKHQGPHGLVAGMTGSGKSEFIITYILSMAVNYSPNEVAFILIDYKGGGLADAFEDKARGIHLPHLVGTITNLDGASIQRSLMSINSELKRRQAIFKAAKSETNEGTMDIYDYQKLYRSRKVKEPMPHLFIISDEFAELKKQQPEFMDELISAARIGRSLGVHLILATQKPGGVVNDQIWSNTKFRVCLRVQDRNDSMEMLKRPEAAELKNTGRFYLQVGYNEFFALGQSAWCGAGYTPQEEFLTTEDNSVRFIDMVGQTTLETRPEVKRSETGSKQIVAIVQYLSDLAKRDGFQAASLWKEPLPDRLELRTLIESAQKPEGWGMSAVVGMVDDPERQEQFPLHLHVQGFHNMLLCGSGGSGKSTFMCTLLYSLVNSYSPEDLNYYILDLSGGILNPFGAMPHCGAYLTENEEADFDRLLALIRELINERRKLFTEAEAFSYDAYRQLRPLPLVLMIIDGFTNITTFRHGNDYYATLHEYMRDGANYGIRFILTCNHVNEVSAKSKQEIDQRIALQAKDRYEYSDILNVKCTFSPPDKRGRGVCAVAGRALEYHTAMLNCEEKESNRASLLRNELEAIARRYEGFAPARRLPMANSEQEYTDFCAGFLSERIPFGYAIQDMRKVAIPLQQLYCMSLYFGNPTGIRPVLQNLIYSFQRNAMDLIVLRRQADTIFDGEFERMVRLSSSGRFTLLDTAADTLPRLDDMMIEEITARNIYRDMYCEQNGIPGTDKARAKKAGKFIRSHTRPLMVLFESFGDLCRLEKDEGLIAEFSAFFSRLRGYNIYFCGCFYPDEEGNLSSNPLMKSFNRDELLLLFGGRYDKQCMISLPMDLRQFEQINPKYNRFVLRYQGKYHTMMMPCGKLELEPEDPDEAPII